MASFQNVPVVPLRRIVELLDIESRKNLLEATANTEIGSALESMQLQKRFICPECVIMTGPRNLNQLEDKLGPTDSEDNSVGRIESSMRRVDKFDFFGQFRHICLGNENYKLDVKCVTEDEELLFGIKQFETIDEYCSVPYFNTETRWLNSNYVEVLKKITLNDDFREKEKAKVKALFLGGSYKGVKIESRIKLFNEEEFQQHIRRCHFSEDLGTKANFDQWAGQYDDQSQKFQVDQLWYTSTHLLDIDKVDELIMSIVISRYYKAVQDVFENDAEALFPESEYKMMQIGRVFNLAVDAMLALRFPTKCSSECDLSLFKFYDLQARFFNAIYQ